MTQFDAHIKSGMKPDIKILLYIKLRTKVDQGGMLSDLVQLPLL